MIVKRLLKYISALDTRTVEKNVEKDSVDKFPPEVFITPSVCQKIRYESLQSGNMETGGMLLGKRRTVNGKKILVISAATGPGAQAKHSVTSFIPDMDHYKNKMKFFLYQHGFVYMGEWHKHPGQLHTPSCTDLDAMKQITFEQDLEDILVGISTTSHVEYLPELGETVDMDFYYFSKGCDDFLKVSPRVLGDSPRLKARHEISSAIIDMEIVTDFISLGTDRMVINGSLADKMVARFLSKPPMDENVLGELVLGTYKNIEISISNTPAELIFIVLPKDDDFSLRCWRIDNSDGEAIEVSVELIDVPKTLFKRLGGLGVKKAVSGKTVAVLGTGSVGSVAAMQLAKAGVRSLVLVDSDRLETHNIVRHLCDLRDLGRKKVDAVADRIGYVSPEVSSSALCKDIIADFEEVINEIKHADLLLVSTDTPDSRRLSNVMSVELEVPAVYISLYERARTGSVQRVIPGLTACRACLGDPKAEFVPGTTDYSNASERDILFQPGLDSDISLVTMLGVRMALATLAEPYAQTPPDLGANFILWNGYPDGQQPLIQVVSEMPIYHECDICSSIRKKGQIVEKFF